MPLDPGELSKPIQPMRPTVPARDFAVSLRFYADLGFQSRALTHDLLEMTLGSCAILLQNYYVREWTDNSVIDIFVSDLNGWWRHIRALDLPGRYGVTRSPRDEGWGVRVAGVVDPAGVLWRFHEGSSRPSSTC